MDLKVGDHVSALRSHNKAVRLTGTIEGIEGNMITMRLDENPNWLETVHIEDVDRLAELPPAETAESEETKD